MVSKCIKIKIMSPLYIPKPIFRLNHSDIFAFFERFWRAKLTVLEILKNLRMSNSSRCAACKSLRRKCRKDCVLAPYFPSTDPQRFSGVHKIFGASNITKMLQQLPVHLRAEAADCMAFEANLRVQDPVYGCVGIIFHLQQQITEAQSEILKTKCEIAYYNTQQLQQKQQGQQLQQQQQQEQFFHSLEPSRHSSSQQDPFLGFQMLTNNDPTFNHFGV